MTAQIIQFRPLKPQGAMTDAEEKLLIRSLVREIAADLGIDLTKPAKPKAGNIP
jgi:hypothetical protein